MSAPRPLFLAIRLAAALVLVVIVIGVCFAKFPPNLPDYRTIVGVTPSRQNYVVLDEQILSNARHDLGDLRLFRDSANAEVPFHLVTERGGDFAGRADARIVSAKRVGGVIQVVLDVTGLTQCDRVDLHLADSARDFIAAANVEGLRSPTDRAGVSLAKSTIFDFTREGLGSGSTLTFPMTRDPYLRLSLTKLSPDQILQATAIDTRVGSPEWTALSEPLPIQQEGNSTVVTWNASPETPVARIQLKVDPSQANFWSDVQVLQPEGGTITNRSVRRVHIRRDGLLAQSEWLDIYLPEQWDSFKLVFSGRGQAPLKITSARAYAYERRVYFDASAGTAFLLFYGNPSLMAPSYTFAPPDQPAETPALATLGPVALNPERNAEASGRAFD